MKNVVITGSTRGIGLAMAKEFLKKGCHVTLSGRGEMTESLALELQGFVPNYFYVKCNVQQKSDLETLWEKAFEKWGNIDIWINNAGQNSPHEFCYDIDEKYVDRIIDTNLKGVIFGSQVASQHMIKQRNGHIYNMEGLGSNDMIQVKTILYGTTKRAVTYFTRALSKELKNTGVKASRLSPGMMLTDFITKTPEGIASPVLQEKNFQFIFNILGDRPERVARFFVSKILLNTRNDAHIVWLTKRKMIGRFLYAPIVRRKII